MNSEVFDGDGASGRYVPPVGNADFVDLSEMLEAVSGCQGVYYQIGHAATYCDHKMLIFSKKKICSDIIVTYFLRYL